MPIGYAEKSGVQKDKNGEEKNKRDNVLADREADSLVLPFTITVTYFV